MSVATQSGMKSQDGVRFLGTDCVRGHVDEGYMHGSLVIRAMEATHYGNLAFVVSLARSDWPHWKTQIKRNVRRFVCREVGLAP